MQDEPRTKTRNENKDQLSPITLTELHDEVQSLKQIISNFENYNNSIKDALIDIAVALEKISNVEKELSKQKNVTDDQENKINTIFNRLPVIEQTISWVNRGIISLIGVLGIILITQFFNNGGIGQ